MATFIEYGETIEGDSVDIQVGWTVQSHADSLNW